MKLWFFLCVIGWLLSAYGWVANIIKLLSVVNDPVTGLEVLRAVGVLFVPLGVVLGFF